MIAYIGASPIFYDDEALGEQLYNMVCDLKVAEKEGIRAVDYFGKDPRAMVDQVLAGVTQTQAQDLILGLVFILGVILIGMRYLMDFTWMMPLKIQPLTYVVFLLNFFGIQSVHHVALVQTELWRNEVVLGYFYKCDQPDSVSEHRTTIFDLFWLHCLFLSDGWAISLAVLVLLGFAVMAYRSRDRLMTSLLVMGLTFLVTGCWIRFVNPETANVLTLATPSYRTSPVPHCISSPKKGESNMTSAIYYEETQALIQTFSQEDQAYFQDLWDYFNFAGFLYEEKALKEQVYNLALDFFTSKRRWMDGQGLFWTGS